MFARNGSSNGASAAVGGNSRRAFRDVTNANRNATSKSSRMHGGVEKKGGTGHGNKLQIAVDQAPSNATMPRQHNNNRFEESVMDERNPAIAVRPANISMFQRPSNVPNPNSYQYSGQVDNIDERDMDDPLCATEYVQDMYALFREREASTSVRPVYMENQTHINERMRSILVDWLVEVHLKFKLVPETLFLTVNIIDRYLEREEVSRPKLQLVGVTALLISSKFEEIYPPELRDLVYICDRAYTRSDIIDMEETILKTLEYQITIPSAHAFLVRYLKAAHADKKIVQLSCYILDGTLHSYQLLHYLPSQLAAAAVFIARRSVGRNSWSPTLLKYAEYCEEEVVPVARAILAEKASTSPELRAVNKKYTSNRYGGVANTVLNLDF
ncbi:G2/mitotic-specific cyclin [Seminavis robusta]|uniref:G2/mitotic-specific cyclin n=1 Tax=Seminavis robusta TaxID=568900 RepID=A0A9N8DFZ1_9STRA|nr:G2/mitotic-specific cyclin [Seminavis robusta]|eukprot:Sro70_g038790.1 G2/mitotic-specific cyclin (385) ;mRNA; f:21448-23021